MLEPWGQQLLNGNAQAFVVAILVLVPFTGRYGAMGMAVATMIKIHPILALVWFVGRRDWNGVAWYAAAMAVLIVVQLPWWPAMIDFYLTTRLRPRPSPGMSLRAIGPVAWIGGTAAVGVAALWFARGRYGWLLATILQLVALPRVLLVNLALLLAAPLPRSAQVASTEPPMPVPSTRPG